MDNLPVMQVPETVAYLLGVLPYQLFANKGFALFMLLYKMQ